ncbi:MAG: PAS domain-containing protein [Verrucomicrobiota bacterium]|nr:PAS domain-containing protein [Verrucomicrobiota bacterium]
MGVDGALSFQDAQGRTRFQNTAHAALFGCDSNGFDKSCREGHIFKQSDVPARLVTAAKTGQSWHGEVDVMTAAGRLAPLEIHALAVRDSQSRPAGAFLLFHDISAKREQERMREREERLQRLESLGQMAGGLAHDFNTYLTVMLGFLGAAKAHPSLPPEVIARLDEVERTGWRARELTEEMLDFARGTEPDKCPLQLGVLAEEAARVGAQGSTASLKFHLTPEAWRVEADPKQIRQIVTNLVRNAAQALGARPGTITLRLENRSRVTGDSAAPIPTNFLCLTVADDGPGIPADKLPHIFEPFYTTKSRGTGLGLPIAHNIVKRHGGFIRVHSQPGKGTIFEVFLPALVAEKAQPGPSAETSEAEAAQPTMTSVAAIA